MDKKIMPVTNDLMFQRIFGRVGNENITKGFLEKILGIEIKSLSLDTNKRMQGDRLGDKTGRIDVKAKLNDGTIAIIEMQIAQYDYMAERLLYYWAKAYTADLSRGQGYGELHKTIAILISVEDLLQTEGIEDYHTRWKIIEENHTNKKFTKDLEIHVVELKKFDIRRNKSPEDNWIKFIKARGKEEMEDITDVDKMLEEAIEEFNKLQSNPEMQEEFEWREKELRDKISFTRYAQRKGMEKRHERAGKRNGKKEAQEEMVINMFKKKFDISTMCDITNLSKQEVEKIIAKIKDN